MLFGTDSVFRVEIDEITYRDGWVFGTFVFHIAGQRVGDADDLVDLRGCNHWIRRFLAKPPLLVHDEWANLPAPEFFRQVYDPTMAGTFPGSDPTDDAFQRYSITHLGMSTFDRYDLLYVEREPGPSTIMWREGNSTPCEASVIATYFRATLRDVQVWLQAQIDLAPRDLR